MKIGDILICKKQHSSINDVSIFVDIFVGDKLIIESIDDDLLYLKYDSIQLIFKLTHNNRFNWYYFVGDYFYTTEELRIKKLQTI